MGSGYPLRRRRVARPGVAPLRRAGFVHHFDRSPERPEDLEDSVTRGSVSAANTVDNIGVRKPTLKLSPEHGDGFRGFEISLGERSLAGKHGIPRPRAWVDPNHECSGRRADEGALDGRP